MKYQSKINEALLNRIISAAYSDAGLIEKIKIYFLAARNKRVKKLLEEYKITARAVHSLEQEKCPDTILKSIKNELSTKENKIITLVSDFLYSVLYRPAISALAAVLFISTLLFFVLFNKTVNKQYSDAQVQLAEKQVKRSLVLVNKIFERTTFKLENDILKKQVAEPVNKGISTINDLFKGG